MGFRRRMVINKSMLASIVPFIALASQVGAIGGTGEESEKVIIKKCKVCGNEFKSKEFTGSGYCSAVCYKRSQSMKCPNCGNNLVETILKKLEENYFYTDVTFKKAVYWEDVEKVLKETLK